MPAAYSEDLAWRVVVRYFWFGQGFADIGDKERGLGVSRHFISDVLARYEDHGDVATHQGKGADPLLKLALTRLEDWQLIWQITSSPRTTLKDHRAIFVLETGVKISYGAFCRAVARLGFTRKKVREFAYQCDVDRANAWLAEVVTFHSVEELGILDETSKDYDVGSKDYDAELRLLAAWDALRPL